MTYLFIRHTVEDFATWKHLFDEHDATRRASGIGDYKLFQFKDDSNSVAILFEIEDLDKARRFVESEDLKEAMQRAGVTGPPDIYYLDEV